ncbi:MAG: PilZ domain-containing protein [PVC group bacterium]|nr:PilZ domain-containing protein [PVC group bacterium]
MGQERRKYIRLKVHSSVANCRLLSIRQRDPCSTFTVWPVKDLGIGGLSVHTEDEVPLDTLAYLNMDLDIAMRTVGVLAKVIWRKAKDVGYELGLQFCGWPKEDDRDAMADYIEHQISSESDSEAIILG